MAVASSVSDSELKAFNLVCDSIITTTCDRTNVLVIIQEMASCKNHINN